MKWDESKHPRDELGRFTDATTYKQNASYSEIMSQSSYAIVMDRMVKVPLEYFANNKRRTINKREVAIDDHTYVFPVDMDIKYGAKPFIFNEPIKVEDIITIVKPKNLREQHRLSYNYGGRRGCWCKKAGNAIVKISGRNVPSQIHWHENTDGTIAGVKVII